MMAGAEYVVRLEWPDGDIGSSDIIDSEEKAHAAVVARRTLAVKATVHKLGPAIEPPEPREWVVVSDDGLVVSGALTTRDEAVRHAHHSSRSVKVLRVVPDDAP